MTYLREIQRPEASDLIQVADQPSPMLQWVEIATMVIDDTYQRPINHGGLSTIRRIAANFRWSCFTPVLLAPIEGGQFAVIDGQHRVHAALLCGIKSVPAMVVPIAATEQAQAFIQVNTARTGISVFSIYKAGLASGEPWAMAAQDAVTAADCRLMSFKPHAAAKKPGQVYCVGLIRDMVIKGHAQAVTVALTAVRSIDAGGNSAVLLYSDWLLNPLLKAVADFPDLSVETLADLLRKKRPMHVMDAAARLAKEENRRASVIAREIFAAAIRQHVMAVTA